MTAVLAQGMKQNLVAGLVFGTALLVGARLLTPDHHRRVPAARGRRPGRRGRARAGDGRVGGVRRRPDPHPVVRRLRLPLRRHRGDRHKHRRRPGACAGCSCSASPSAAAPHSCWPASLIHLRRIWRFDRTLTVATLLVDHRRRTRPAPGRELLAAVPVRDRARALVLCTALLLAMRTDVAARARVLVVASAIVSVLATGIWTIVDLAGVAGSDATPDRRGAQARGRARRHDRGVRRPAGDPAGQRHGVAVRAPVEPADAHPRPGPRRAADRARRPRRAHVGRDVGAGVGVGRPGRCTRADPRRAVPAARTGLRRQAGLPARRREQAAAAAELRPDRRLRVLADPRPLRPGAA